jgi:hypothetical protein
MEEEVVALYQNRAKKKELEEGKKGSADRETDDETLLSNLKGSPLGVGQLEEVSAPLHFGVVVHMRLLMMIMLLSVAPVVRNIMFPSCLSWIKNYLSQAVQSSYIKRYLVCRLQLICRVWQLLGCYLTTSILLFLS